jgi:hypothetical protein
VGQVGASVLDSLPPVTGRLMALLEVGRCGSAMLGKWEAAYLGAFPLLKNSLHFILSDTQLSLPH